MIEEIRYICVYYLQGLKRGSRHLRQPWLLQSFASSSFSCSCIAAVRAVLRASAFPPVILSAPLVPRMILGQAQDLRSQKRYTYEAF